MNAFQVEVRNWSSDTVFVSDEEAEARRLCLTVEAYRERQAKAEAEKEANSSALAEELAERASRMAATAALAASAPEAVSRINAAMDTLEAEGCDVPLARLHVNRKGAVDYQMKSSDVGFSGVLKLSREALRLNRDFQDQAALEDEVANILGLLAE